MQSFDNWLKKQTLTISMITKLVLDKADADKNYSVGIWLSLQWSLFKAMENKFFTKMIFFSNTVTP